MYYIELSIPLTASEPDEQADILTAWLSEFPFDTFLTEDGCLKAYAPEEEYLSVSEAVEAILAEQQVEEWSSARIEKEDWNATWEADFEPIAIDDLCTVRTPSHPAPEVGLDVLIVPKMSFGTGHHQTTRLMIRHLFEQSVAGKSVLDVGCGTGVLSIVAVGLGAESVVAVDIDDWAAENCADNCALNGVSERVTSLVGTVESVAEQRFDVVLANINLNILLHDLPHYRARLAEGGLLMMSGFLESDVATITAAAEAFGIVPIAQKESDGWVAIAFRG